MSKNNPLISSIFLALFALIFAAQLQAQTNNPRDFSERFVFQAVRTIHSAEATFQSTTGAGLYGSLAELRAANLIDAALASGEKYGYLFILSKTAPTATMPAKFYLTATPRSYPKSGRRSFYIDETGELHGADKNGATADSTDPLIDDCASFGIFDNERCTIFDMRTLANAQKTYQSIIGSGNYAYTFTALYTAGLINSRLGTGTNHDYSFSLQTINQGPGVPAFFSFSAAPTNYGVTGVRSFYIDSTGILRGADKQGQPADENDPPIDN